MSFASINNFVPPYPALRTAVLFLVFNRPDVTAQVFEAIRQARPPRLYVAADGSRSNRPDEAELCAEVRRIATKVDWPCDVKTLFRENNLGCKAGVSSGISWFFENEEEGIILEDDCLPCQSFFWFCEELLEKYRRDSRVAMVAGTKLCNAHEVNGESYFFSRLVQIWGWATWRRAWVKYDCDMAGWSDFIKRDGFLNLGISNKITQYLTNSYRMAANNEIDTWDYQWSYSVLSNSMYVAVPITNLIQNIGFGIDATHTVNADSSHARLELGRLQFPLMHPNFVMPNLQYDLAKIQNGSSGLVNKLARKLKGFVKQNAY